MRLDWSIFSISFVSDVRVEIIAALIMSIISPCFHFSQVVAHQHLQNKMRQRHLPRRSDLDDTDRLIWEDLQRLFRKDLLEMEQQLAASDLRASSSPESKSFMSPQSKLMLGGPTSGHNTNSGHMTAAHSVDEAPTRNPSATTESSNAKPRHRQQQTAAISRKRSCFLCLALTLILSTVLSILIIPVVLWASSSMRDALKDASSALEKGNSGGSDGYSFDDATYQAFMRTRTAGAEQHTSLFATRPAHHHRTYPPTSTQSSHHYAKDSAWHTLRNDRFPLVVANAVPGRPPPLVWLPRYHARLMSSLNCSTANESLSTNESPSLV
jgi:hypothetical protein